MFKLSGCICIHLLLEWISGISPCDWLRYRGNEYFFCSWKPLFLSLRLRLTLLMWKTPAVPLKSRRRVVFFVQCSSAHSLCSHLWVGKNFTDGQCSVSVCGLVSKGQGASASFSWNLEVGLGQLLFFTWGILSPVQWEYCTSNSYVVKTLMPSMSDSVGCRILCTDGRNSLNSLKFQKVGHK